VIDHLLEIVLFGLPLRSEGIAETKLDLVERRIRAEPWCFAEAYMASSGT
jgi:hypothetical protein